MVAREALIRSGGSPRLFPRTLAFVLLLHSKENGVVVWCSEATATPMRRGPRDSVCLELGMI